MPLNNITPAYQQEFLNSLLTFLTELEYEAAIAETEVGDNKCYSTLFTVLNISSDQLPGDSMLRVESAFLPIAEGDKGTHSNLQMMTPILLADQNVDLNELFALLVKLNTFLPIGSFGYWAEQNMVYHKQNNMVANKGKAEVFAGLEEQLALIQYVLTSFVPSLAAVSINGTSAQDALANNPFAQVYI